MRKLSIGIALLLLLTGCGSSESADGTRDAGDCTTLGEIIESNGELAICVNLEGKKTYLIEGPAIDDIKLLAGITYSTVSLTDEGEALEAKYGWGWEDYNRIQYETLSLKRYIADKPEWSEVAGLILAEEKAGIELDYVFKNYCPTDPEAYCAPKTMSAEGVAEFDRKDAIFSNAQEALGKKLDLIGVAIEGQYQVESLKAVEFVMKSLKNAGN
jgi:hypothetical protein